MGFLGKLVVMAGLFAAAILCYQCFFLGPAKAHGEHSGVKSRYTRPGREKVVHAVDTMSMVSACATMLSKWTKPHLWADP